MRDLRAEFRVNYKHTSANKACLREDQTHSALKNYIGALQACCSCFLKVSSSQRLWIYSPKKSEAIVGSLSYELPFGYKGKNAPQLENKIQMVASTLHYTLAKSLAPSHLSSVSSCRDGISPPLQASPPPECQVKGHRDAQSCPRHFPILSYVYLEITASISMSFKTHWHVTSSPVIISDPGLPLVSRLMQQLCNLGVQHWNFPITHQVLLTMAFTFEMLYYSKAKAIQYCPKKIKNCLTILP